MPFLILDVDDSILDIVADNTGNLPEISQADMDTINASQYGHASFNYVNSVLVLVQSRIDDNEFPKNKLKFYNDTIELEKTLMAKERAAPLLVAIQNVQNQEALDVLKGV